MKQVWFQRAFVVDNWPKEAIALLKTFAVDLDAAADFCGQPRGSIVLAGTGSPSVPGTGTPPAPETKTVDAHTICEGLGWSVTNGNIRKIEERMISLFGQPRRDKNFNLIWDVPPGWTYPQE